MDELAMFFAQQCKTALIETSHVLSENFGIKLFTDELRTEFAPVPVQFYEIKLPYSTYSQAEISCS